MPALPTGEPAPRDGALPESALHNVGKAGFGIYLHVPFCASRCGYCDFNTYTPAELGGAVDFGSYITAARLEIAMARRVLGDNAPPVDTVFVGGGTPSLLPVAQLAELLTSIDTEFGLADDAEITTEANPDSVDGTKLRELRAAGFNRISLGMQSAARHVLAVLDRQHTPGRAVAAAAEAQAAGFAHINMDLIYGAAGETDADWLTSLRAVIDAGVDHVSAYALIIEDGTRLARQVAAGAVARVDDDILADRYLLAEAELSRAGFDWYEVSNWARDNAARCRHNLGYWAGGDWWGIGPGAHSHVGGVRWWNVKHPAQYAGALSAGTSPAAGREILDADTRALEMLMLELRVAGGLSTATLNPAQLAVLDRQLADGLLEPVAVQAGRAVLTLRGRLLADAVVRDLAVVA